MTSAMTDYIHVSDGGEVSFIPGEMTDNRTTELLREGLNERGIEWRSGLEGVTFVGDWCFVEYDNGRLAATCEPVLTAEQAIAATMGSGTLTAEQVEKAIHDCSTYASYDGCTYYASGIRLQAIADELNAELVSGTCENVAREWEKTSFAHAGTSFCCSECGAHYVDAECYYAGLADKDEEQIRTNFCPNCGRRVSA